ncbi:uncharacterized protein TNCV_5096481, partial [Trichonephila clavipes]
LLKGATSADEGERDGRPRTCELHDLSNHHEQNQAIIWNFRRQNLTKFPPARNLEIPSQVSQLFIFLFTGWTDVLPAPKFFHGHVHFRQTGHDQEKSGDGKDSTEEFIFPKKTARPISPTSTQDPIETNNSFSDLEQDVEHPPSIETVTTEVVTPKIPPHPIMLKIKDNFREQIKCISEKFPNLRNRIVNDVVKMFSTDHEEYRKLKHFLETDKDFEFYILKRQKDKPIKAVIKGLPNSALITDITNDLKLIGFNIDSCTQLISKRTKKIPPIFPNYFTKKRLK